MHILFKNFPSPFTKEKESESPRDDMFFALNCARLTFQEKMRDFLLELSSTQKSHSYTNLTGSGLKKKKKLVQG